MKSVGMKAQDTTWDIVIAGGGLAGLSLAAELAAPQFAHLRVLLVEPRKAYVRDRTWSFWALPNALPQRWQSLAATNWQQWRVSCGERSVTSVGKVAYTSVRADAFYETALDIIAQAPHIEWLRPATIAQVQASAEGVALTLDSGERLQCKRLFDSRPPVPLNPSDWVQHFAGWEVQSSKPCFDPKRVELMAFEPHANGLHFIYLLPYSPSQALVESTWISRANVKAQADQELKNALQQRWGCVDYDITFREQGALPLLPKFPADQQNVTRIGRAGGTLRAATGYSFCATLQQTSALASSLVQQLRLGDSLAAWQAPVFQNHPMDQWMDSVLFRVLERDWMAAPSYFLSLFENVPEQQLVRFLQGQADWRDRFAVMKALPPWPFMQAALG